MAATHTTTYLTTTSHNVATVTSTIVAALQAPPGYQVDFDNPMRKGDMQGYWVFAVGIVMSFLFLIMRLYTKIVVSRSFVVDDACIVVSFTLGLGCQSILLYMWKNEIQGVHAWEVPVDRYNLYNLLIMCASVLYAPTQGFAKLSLLLFYRRLAPFQWFQAAIYAVMFIVVAYTLGIIFSLIFPCTPLASNWDVTLPGHCINKVGIYLATAVINIFTDIALLLLPVPVLARLQIPRLEKAALIAMFGVGSMTCITSIVRLVILIPMLTDPDQTWAVSIPCVWILVEANLVVICGCLPIVRKFARHVSPKLFSDHSSGSDSDPSAKAKAAARMDRKTFDFLTIGSIRSRPMRSRKGRRGRSDEGEEVGDVELEEGRVSAAGWSEGGSEMGFVETKMTGMTASTGTLGEGEGEGEGSGGKGFGRAAGV